MNKSDLFRLTQSSEEKVLSANEKATRLIRNKNFVVTPYLAQVIGIDSAIQGELGNKGNLTRSPSGRMTLIKAVGEQ